MVDQCEVRMQSVEGKIPVSEFNKTAIIAFERLKEDITDEAAAALERAEITCDGINMEKEGIKAPSSTWTYLINNRPEQLGIIQFPIAVAPLSILLSVPVWAYAAMKQRMSKHVD